MEHSLLYILLFLAPFSGGLIAYFYSGKKQTQFPVIMGFVGAFLFSVVLVGMLPHMYHEQGTSLVIFIILGFFLESLLEFVFGKGHSHHDHHHHGESHESHALPIGLFLALAIHSFLESTPLTEQIGEGIGLQNGFIFGIAFHEAIAAFSLIILISSAGVSKKIVLLSAFAYALISPIGAWTGSLIHDSLHHDEIMPKLLAVAVGTILHVSMDVLSTPLHSRSKQAIKFIAIALGIAAGFLLIH